MATVSKLGNNANWLTRHAYQGQQLSFLESHSTLLSAEKKEDRKGRGLINDTLSL